MADIDEDNPLPSSQAPMDIDLSDETQDFRFLSALSNPTSTSSASNGPSIPKRGEKDFEPNPTSHQSSALAASREAMHNALAHPRLHHPKHVVVGIYVPHIPREYVVERFPPRQGTLASKRWEDFCVVVPVAHGILFKSIGTADARNRIWLLPEEALYLIERGSLDIRWPTDKTLRISEKVVKIEEIETCVPETDAEGELEDEDCVPMSLQAAYALFIGRAGLVVERYTVYAGLRRGGYAVLRAESGAWGEVSATVVANTPESEVENGNGWWSGWLALIHQAVTGWEGPLSRRNAAYGPLVGMGLYRNYIDVYRSLNRLIPFHDPASPKNQTSTRPLPAKSTSAPPSPYLPTYHLYKPSTPLKKTTPPPPDYILIVLSTTSPTTAHIPTLSELDIALSNTPYAPAISPSYSPEQNSRMQRNVMGRLKHGYRNVVLGVVDRGVTSFVRIADAGIGREKIYERIGGAGGKGKGGGGGRGGRGGGRGGRGRGRGK